MQNLNLWFSRTTLCLTLNITVSDGGLGLTHTNKETVRGLRT